TPDMVSMELHNGPKGNLTLCQPSWAERAEQLHLLLQLVFFYLVPLIIMTFTYVRVALCLWRSGSIDENDEAAASVPRAQMQLRRKKAKMLIVVVLIFAVCYLPVYILFILCDGRSYAATSDSRRLVPSFSRASIKTCTKPGNNTHATSYPDCKIVLDPSPWTEDVFKDWKYHPRTIPGLQGCPGATGALRYFPHSAVPPLAMLSHWLCYFNSSINPVIYNFMSCNFRREFRVACYLCCRRGSNRRMAAYE
ncbi:hypothetical protein BaRGS_00007622, partial [Batillaria attramentaria]